MFLGASPARGLLKFVFSISAAGLLSAHAPSLSTPSTSSNSSSNQLTQSGQSAQSSALSPAELVFLQKTFAEFPDELKNRKFVTNKAMSLVGTNGQSPGFDRFKERYVDYKRLALRFKKQATDMDLEHEKSWVKTLKIRTKLNSLSYKALISRQRMEDVSGKPGLAKIDAFLQVTPLLVEEMAECGSPMSSNHL